MAEPEMCIPQMKRLAEQRVDRIIETSPNGIVIVDEHLRILHMNPAFRRFFLCSDALYGQPISYADGPRTVCAAWPRGKSRSMEKIVEHTRYQPHLPRDSSIRCARRGSTWASIVNITNSRANQEKLDQLRAQTVLQARELLDHQIRMAENLARFLGESTAQG